MKLKQALLSLIIKADKIEIMKRSINYNQSLVVEVTY